VSACGWHRSSAVCAPCREKGSPRRSSAVWRRLESLSLRRLPKGPMGRLVVGALRRTAGRWWRRARRLGTAWSGKRRAREEQSRRRGGASAKKHRRYEDWITRHDRLSAADRTLIRNHIAAFTHTPRLSVLLPLYEDAPDYVREALDSVTAQLYDEWELCVVADASVSPTTLGGVEEIACSDPRIKLFLLETAATAAARVNEALAVGTGEMVVLLDQYDSLAEHALYLVADAVNANPDAAIVYSDEDEIDRSGRRSRPYFKPDWETTFSSGRTCSVTWPHSARSLRVRVNRGCPRGIRRSPRVGSRAAHARCRAVGERQARPLRPLPTPSRRGCRVARAGVRGS
jgi:hypothetical protein